jgi:rare lipoprotein A (peptidoglycan hydrolase)
MPPQAPPAVQGPFNAALSNTQLSPTPGFGVTHADEQPVVTAPPPNPQVVNRDITPPPYSSSAGAFSRAVVPPETARGFDTNMDSAEGVSTRGGAAVDDRNDSDRLTANGEWYNISSYQAYM